ncbi:MAG: GNAT family N-acetyltransferase, partial [Gammaproteobacteria bacterium]|nr:GNAT family N-acetyltransferase [Gammaproteobacteria bacterium]
GCSSLHILFPHVDELPIMAEAGLKVRKDCQFHWHNRDYSSFDDFLGGFSSRKRKKVRQDRRKIAAQGITFRWLRGSEISADTWQEVYRLISITFMRRGSMPYYDCGFFRQVSAQLGEGIAVVLAELNSEVVAAAVFFVGADTLYGRYWGSAGYFDALHFETCYYQGIDFCIRNRIGHFEPGTQGEHKISRGFVPETTWSAHWLARPEFFEAIGRFLDDEGKHVDRYADAVRAHSPYRKNGPPESGGGQG